MTVTTHTYNAFLVGAPDVPLSLRGGSITVDEGAAPHVQGTISVAIPALAALTALDPRETRRIRVEAASTGTSGAHARVFDLSLRDRAVSHRDGVVSLAVASDESLLGEYAPLSDDFAPLQLAPSLRSVVGYALGKIGAVLAPSPALDAVVTMLDVDNSVTNPVCATDAGGWQFFTNGASGTSARTTGATPEPGVTTFYRCSFTGTAAGVRAGAFYRIVNGVKAGNSYTTSVWMRTNLVQKMRLAIEWADKNGAQITEVWSPPVSLPANTWVRVVLADKIAPDAATGFTVTMYGETGGTVWTAGKQLDVTGLRVGPTASEPLTWRAGVSGLAFLAPLLQAKGYRLVCDESRSWTIRDQTYVADGSLSIRHGVNLVDGADKIARDDGLWFDAQVTRYKWTGADGQQRETVDSYALTSSPSRVNVVEIEGVYPGAGRSQYAVQRAQGRGRDVSATVVTDWTARAEQPITILLNGAPAQVGRTSSVRFDLDRDEMTITTRTTDTPIGAIDLLTGTIDALPGTINGL